MLVYHFSDTARLPWILRSGELRPGRNRIGGFPDPDFLWATTEAAGDLTSSANRGEPYRSGKMRHVRFALESALFFPWQQVAERFPQWTVDEMERLVRAAKGSAKPSAWWCCADPVPLSSCLYIETRSYNDNRWVSLPRDAEARPVDGLHGGLWLGVKIAGRLFASREEPFIDGAVGYQIATGQA